ncbi:MAG: TlpA family protein disulfide reductase [Thermomicrobiales bacterium]
MNVSLPLWIVVAQWILLLGLGLLVVVLYRQLGYYLRLQRIGAENLGLAVGEPAPAFDFAGVDGTTSVAQRFNPGGQWSLLLFADPQCAGCERALYALESLREQGAISHVRTIVVTHAEAAQLAVDEVFRATAAEIARIENDHVADLYRIRRTPFAYLVDPQGVVRTKGVTEDQGTLRDLLKPASRSSIPLIPVVSSSSGAS